MVKAVLFDLDGTLLNREASIERFIAAQYDRLSAPLSHISKIDYTTKFIELDCRGHVQKDKVYQTLVAEFEIGEVSWQALLEDYEAQFQFRLGVLASDSIFVGDHPKAYIAGAKSVKMRTIWKRSSHWLEAEDADAIIDELNEIPLVLEQFKSR